MLDRADKIFITISSFDLFQLVLSCKLHLRLWMQRDVLDDESYVLHVIGGVCKLHYVGAYIHLVIEIDLLQDLHLTLEISHGRRLALFHDLRDHWLWILCIYRHQYL